ncbi:hypothetical protein E8F11_19200 [Pseudomonas sp. BN417]|uniref:hypothetical protein n=1 Tax=Pseudomonas sp. BN417 TaxID=2567890 RepID=UPI002454887A|nr:hypothetical protein [Pseudomonas sp. BN417]MDH4557273.1 hypothetical protein [Pseudomonas sp. BN417]
MMAPEDFSKELLGYNIVDCVVRSRDKFYFLAREDYTQWTDWEDVGRYPDDTALILRVISDFSFKPKDSQWGHATLTGFDISDAAVSLNQKEQLVVSSISGQVYAVGSGEAGMEDNILSQTRGGVFRLKTISDTLYAAGGMRTFGFREQKNRWHWHNKNIPLTEVDKSGRPGFRDLDGFSKDDIYAVGGYGDVWSFNGNAWRRVDFPSNLFLETVCCGADGRVYISGYEGHTFVGRGDTWKKVKSKELISLAFKDMVWYEDRVWCTNDYGVWWIVGDQLVKANIPAFSQISAGHLSTRDGVLLLAGFYGAAYLENGQWHQIFSYGEMVDRCKAEGLYDGVLQARWHEFKD